MTRWDCVSTDASRTFPSDLSGFLSTEDAEANEAMVVTSATSLGKNITSGRSRPGSEGRFYLGEVEVV